MSAKHTPAPWFACCHNTEAHYVFAGECETTVCIPCQNDPSSGNFEELSGIVTKEQRLANARLIAAAPDLLAALIELSDWYKSEIGLPAAKANSAIAKAKGEAQ